MEAAEHAIYHNPKRLVADIRVCVPFAKVA